MMKRFYQMPIVKLFRVWAKFLYWYHECKLHTCQYE